METAGPASVEPVRFGALLKRYRVAARLSQEELAERARLSARAISAYERGQRQVPYRDTVQLLADALGLSPEEADALEATVPRRRGPEATARPPDTAPATHAPQTARTNLPVQLTSFVGRLREIDEVMRLLEQIRLLTLTGTGGTGKTRLALQVAAAVLDHFPHGVWVVELATLADTAVVPRAVASALGLREGASDSLLARLQEAVRTRHLLLVLDNCEHLLDACATLAETLLRAGPRLRILATSREALGIAGETSWRVPSLALPDSEHLSSLETLLHCEAVQLFVERAAAVQPHFALTAGNAPVVIQVCQRLDGIPLAIELAAARVRGLAVEHIAARLDQRLRLLTGGSRTALPRQQTLRATVDWSYGLLSDAEQRLFNRLAVFAGGFTLEAAEVVCAGDSMAADEVLDVLLRLIDKSLVVAEERAGGVERYRLLETLRQYGWERLATGGEAAAMQARHAQYYLALAEQAEQALRGPAQGVWLDRLEHEHANLGAALAWSLDDGERRAYMTGEAGAEPDIGLRLAGALHWFWVIRGHRWEGRRWLARALAQRPEAPGPAQAKALTAAGELAAVTGDRMHVVLALLAESVTLYRAVGEQRGLTYALCWLGFYTRGQELGVETWNRGDYARGTVLLTESLALARAAGDRWHIAWSLLLLALSTDVHRDEERARGRMAAEESLPLMHQVGDIFGVDLLHRSLGWLALYEGDYTRAGVAFSAELAAVRSIDDQASIAFALSNLGDVARVQGAFVEAAVRYEESLALYRVFDFDQDLMARVLRRLGEVALEQGDWTLAQARVRESLVTTRAQGESGESQLAPALEVLGGLAAARGRAARALCLAGAAAVQRERISQSPWPQEQRALARWLAPARQALSEAAQRAAWAEGQALPLEEAIALALVEAGPSI